MYCWMLVGLQNVTACAAWRGGVAKHGDPQPLRCIRVCLECLQAFLFRMYCGWEGLKKSGWGDRMLLLARARSNILASLGWETERFLNCCEVNLLFTSPTAQKRFLVRFEHLLMVFKQISKTETILYTCLNTYVCIRDGLFFSARNVLLPQMAAKLPV